MFIQAGDVEEEKRNRNWSLSRRHKVSFSSMYILWKKCLSKMGGTC